MIYSPFTSKYQSSEPITTSKMTFFCRLFEEIGHLFDSPFKWDDIFIAGGFLSGLIETKYNPELYKESDIDMYVCADTPNQLIKRMKEVIKHIQQNTEDVYFIIGGCSNIMLIDCLIKGWRRRLQLIGLTSSSNFPIPHDRSNKKCPTILEVIREFDLTHCQIAFDGNDVVCTPEFVNSITTRQTLINPSTHSIHAYRLVKAYIRGYSIGQPKHNIYIKNFYRRNYNECVVNNKMPTLTNRIWHTQFMNQEFDHLLGDPIVKQNLQKNFMINFEWDVTHRLQKINELSDWTIDLFVFGKQGQILIERTDKTHFIAGNDPCDSHSIHPSLDQMMDAMRITNVLTR